MRTEIFVSIRKNAIGSDLMSFKHLIMAKGNIEIKDKKITHNNIEYPCDIKEYHDSENNEFVNFHLTFRTNNDDLELDSDEVKKYIELQKDIEDVLRTVAVNVELLWDDVSFKCAQAAYPLIYTIENKMRMLIIKFMLLNEGTEWETENFPEDLKEKRSMKRLAQKEEDQKNKKDKAEEDDQKGEKSSIVYKLDFCDLPNLLFTPYVPKGLPNIRELLKNKIISQEDILSYIPRSNWERYFDTLINVKQNELNERWKKLYKLRCTIAHNGHLTFDELQEIRSHYKRLEEILDQALEKIDEIKVPKEDMESVHEEIASKNDEKLSLFLREFNQMIHSIQELCYYRGIDYKTPVKSAEELVSQNIIYPYTYDMLRELCKVRNDIVHASLSTPCLEEENMDEYINNLNAIRIFLDCAVTEEKTFRKDLYTF